MLGTVYMFSCGVRARMREVRVGFGRMGELVGC